METFKERLITEKTSLEEKINALSKFLFSDKFKTLSKMQQTLLVKQHKIMIQYADILSLRLEELL